MKLILLIILTLPALLGCAHWTRTEKVLAGTFVAGQAINYAQTKYVLTNDDWHEINPITDAVGKDYLLPYKLGSTLLVLGIANYVSPKWRKGILIVSNALVWGFVGHDLIVGVGMTW